MDLLPSGYNDKDIKLLFIEHELFNLTIKGKPIHPNIEALNINKDENGNIITALLEIISYEYQCKSKVFNPYIDDCNLDEYIETEVFPCFYENQNYQIIIESKTKNEIYFFHENKRLREAVDYIGSKQILAGVLNFKNEIGYSEFEIISNRRKLLKVKIEIFPTKMDYKTDYINLIREVNEEVYNLAYDFLNKTYFSTKLSHTNNQTMSEYYSILKKIFNKFDKSIKWISQNPHHKLKEKINIVEIHKARNVNRNTIEWIRNNPHLLKKSPKGIMINNKYYLPQKVLESRKENTYDTFENRFVKWILKKVVSKSQQLIKNYKSIYGGTSSYDEHFIKNINQIIKKCKNHLKLDFLKGISEIYCIGSASLVLQMGPGYRDIYKYYLMLIKGLSIESDLYNLSLKQIWLLYEYWCFLKLNRLLSENYNLVNHNLIKIKNNGLYLTLNKSKAAKLTYQNPINGEKFTLMYNVIEGSTDATVVQKPDTVLSLEKEGSDIQYKYIFDAKYRIDPALKDTPYGDRYNMIPGPQEEDINTMHRYRDAIVAESKINEEYNKTIFGAYILFPFSDEEKYRNHRLYKSISKVNIGGLPFLPGHTKLLKELLDKLIVQTPKTVQENTMVNIGTIEHYEDIYSNRSMLIGSVKSKKQLNANLKYRFYHIPYKNIDLNNKIIEYIGLYQSKKNFGNESGVKYYGKVKKWEVIRRSEIKEIPKEDDRLYVLFRVENWKERKEKIEILESGIVGSHIYTTKQLFDRADVYPILNLKNKLEIRLWDELKRINNYVKIVENYTNINNDFNIPILDLNILIKGEQTIIKKDNLKIEIKTKRLLTSPKRIINLIIKELFDDNHKFKE